MVGTALTLGVIAYEFGTDRWDAHTVANTVMLGAGVAATVLGAPIVLTGIAAYGIGDYFFDFSGKIDSTVGWNSNIW